MKYLMENEAGFDPDSIGFPSIQGCHAIVYQTSVGLWGYHNFGGSGASAFKKRANLFRDFVEDHFIAAGTGECLYGCTFVGNNARGYSGSPSASWKKELKQFAIALDYKGSIMGFDLSTKLTNNADSAYVEYRKSGAKCRIYVKKWSDEGIVRSDVTTSGRRMNLRKIVGSRPNKKQTTAVDTSGLTLVKARKL